MKTIVEELKYCERQQYSKTYAVKLLLSKSFSKKEIQQHINGFFFPRKSKSNPYGFAFIALSGLLLYSLKGYYGFFDISDGFDDFVPLVHLIIKPGLSIGLLIQGILLLVNRGSYDLSIKIFLSILAVLVILVSSRTYIGLSTSIAVLVVLIITRTYKQEEEKSSLSELDYIITKLGLGEAPKIIELWLSSKPWKGSTIGLWYILLFFLYLSTSFMLQTDTIQNFYESTAEKLNLEIITVYLRFVIWIMTFVFGILWFINKNIMRFALKVFAVLTCTLLIITFFLPEENTAQIIAVSIHLLTTLAYIFKQRL